MRNLYNWYVGHKIALKYLGIKGYMHLYIYQYIIYPTRKW